MSYAIIRNENYKIGQLGLIYRHNERKNTNYSNKEINKNSLIKNYSIKACNTTYQNAFKILKEKYNLKGQIKKVSNIVCEFVITSDKDFFEKIGPEETRRYFETAYKFVANYKNLGEQYILSAKVHNDESTPHMHLVYVPVVHTKDKNGKEVNKIACSEYWKGKDSYKRLQDNFYAYMIKSGFDLERGNTKGNEHIPIEKLKQITNYEVQEIFKSNENLEQEKITNDIEVMRENYQRVISKYNTLVKRYTRVKNIIDETMYKTQKIQQENYNLKRENINLNNEIVKLKDYIDKTLEYVSLLFDFSKERLKRLVNLFIQGLTK